MHRGLKKLLETAHGESNFVFVTFLDVRGFSTFAGLAESSETAIYLRRIYLRILNEHIPEWDFFKPTGDGLLIIRKYDDASLSSVVQESVEASLKLSKEFHSLCAGDPMINFDVPENLGIGLTRGAATNLVSGTKVLDCTGRPLNLAARLMDVARPSGVVLDRSAAAGLLETAVESEFRVESVYIRGLAEKEPMEVLVTSDITEIPRANRFPINQYEEERTETEKLPFKVFKDRAIFLHPLKSEPENRDEIIGMFSYPMATASKTQHPHYVHTYRATAKYRKYEGQPHAVLNYNEILPIFLANGIKPSWEISLYFEYPVVPKAT